ncbi:MAG: Do family serine endopeptidase [Marinicellaceae bacterium]
MKTKITPIIFGILVLAISTLSHAKQVYLPDFTTLVEKTGPAVVNIMATTNASESGQQSPYGSQLERFFGLPQQPQQDRQAGGSGFIISEDGYVLTNRHVIYGADEITVKLIDKREFKAELIGEDEASDIALLKLDADDLPILKIGESKKSKIGEWVMAIGSPLSYENSVTKGIISAKGRKFNRQNYVPYIQTDVPINRGNSGGPLINMDAEVIGINTLILSSTGGYMGLSFSVPIDVAMSVVEQLKSSGTVKRGLLGVNIQQVSPQMAEYLGLDRPKGALVTNVNEGSAAAEAGIKVQDVIVKFNGETVESSELLPPMVGLVKPGTKVMLDVLRDGDSKVIYAVLDGLENSNVIAASTEPKSEKLEVGFEVADLSEDEKEQLDLEMGVYVKEVNNRKVTKAGLNPGDIIVSMSKVKVKNVKHFKELLNNLEEDEPIVLLIKQGAGNRFIVIERS